MTILDDIRAAIGGAFGDTSLFFSDATLTRPAQGGGWNAGTGTPQTYPCKAMIEAYSDHLRAVADIPGTDVRLMIVGTSIAVDPLKGDRVTIGGSTWALIQVDTDPARAMWTCQARPV